MSDSPIVSVLLVTYNNARHVVPCLAALSFAAMDVPIEVIVVDNGSSDDTLLNLRSQPLETHVEEAGWNLGFAAGCNRAARRASGRYLLLLNPDTRVREDTLTALLRCAAEHPQAGIYGGLARDEHGRDLLDNSAAQPTLWSAFCFATGLSTAFSGSPLLNPEARGTGDPHRLRPVGVVTGLLTLIDRDLWNRLGGFDEDYWMYSEDVDLCFRAAEAGHQPIVTPDAIAVHEGGGSSETSGDKRVLVMRGRTTMMRKQWGFMSAWSGIALLWLGVALRGTLALVVARLGSQRGTDWTDALRRSAEWVPGYVTRR